MSQAAEQTPSPPSWTSRSETTGRLWQGGSHGPGWVWRASAQQSHPMQDTRAQVGGRGHPHRGQPGWGPEHELEGRQESGASVGQVPLDERLRSWEWGGLGCGGDFIEKASRHHLQKTITMTITGKRTTGLTSCPETWEDRRHSDVTAKDTYTESCCKDTSHKPKLRAILERAGWKNLKAPR